MMARVRDDDSGAVYVLAALSFFVLLAMAAFAVDLGWVFLNKSRAQRAADAAALAGVTALPAEPTVAINTALDFARLNGYDDADPDVVVVPTPTGDNELRVQIDDQVPTFFMQAFGIDTVHIDVASKARYISSVPLGNPDNIFGPEPGTPGQTFQDVGFWPAITYEFDEKRNGDPYATRCVTRNGDATACTAANGEWYNGDGYWYAVEVPSGTTNLSVDIYDAGYGQAGNASDPDNFPVESALESSSAFDATSEEQRLVVNGAVADGTGTYRVTFFGFTTDPITLAADPATSGNNLVVAMESALQPFIPGFDADITTATQVGGNYAFEFLIDNPAGFDFDLITCDRSGLAASGAGALQCFGEPMEDGAPGRSPDTTYTLFGPDQTPFDPRDNPGIGCSRTFGAEVVPGTNYSWTQLCSIANPTPGIYPLRVTAAPGRTWNEYSLRATADSGTVRLYALEDLSIASRITNGATRFFLAEIDEQYRGLTFVIELFDPGDMVGGGSSAMSIVGPKGNIWDLGCSYQVSRDPAGAPAYGPATALPGNCTIDTTRTAANDGFQADWLKINIPLPNTYECDDSSGSDDCWWEVQYDYQGTAQERTTWRASVEGSQVALVFEPEP